MTVRPFLAAIACLLARIPVLAQPALPNTAAVELCFPDTTGYTLITVGPGKMYGDLQQAIDAAPLGSVLLLDAGSTFTGGFTLPEKATGNGWIVIRSSRMDLLPKDGMRVNPTALTGSGGFPWQADALPKIVTTNTSGIPCVATGARAHHYRFVGLEFTVDTSVKNSYGLINLGDASAAQNSLALVPHHIIIDRCYIHGHRNGTIMKYGVRLDCAIAGIIDSYIADFHSIGYDAQAIAGINGPGPFKIINNYLEASGENIMFGGAPAAIAGLVPSDIEVRQNFLYKPLRWRIEDPDYAGQHWTVKNLFELKTGTRVLLDGNLMENCWADLPTGQSGYAIVLTVRTESGGSPQADVSDITISNNIVRHTGAGITLSGRDDGGVGIRSKRIRIYNNLFEDINGPAYGDKNTAGPNDGVFLKIGEPQDVEVQHNTIFQTGAITWAYKPMSGFVFTNNIVNSAVSAGGYQGIYGPGYGTGNGTMGYYFSDITDANRRFDRNALIGGNAAAYSNYATLSRSLFPAKAAYVGFSNLSGAPADYHGYALTTLSAYHKFASDGKDSGVDFALLDSAFRAPRCAPVSTGCDDAPSSAQAMQLYPNPAWGALRVAVPGNAATAYRITDITGRVLLSGAAPSGVFTLDIAGLRAGQHILSVHNGTRLYTRLLLIRR